MLLALLPLGAGGVLVGVHSTQRDADGFYASGANPLSTSTHALVSETLDVGTDGPDWLFRKGRLGTIRVTANAPRTSQSSSASPVGRSRFVSARASPTDEIKDFDLDPFTVTTVRQPGASTPARPVTQNIWAESANRDWPAERRLASEEGRLGRGRDERRRLSRRHRPTSPSAPSSASCSGSASRCSLSARFFCSAAAAMILGGTRRAAAVRIRP